MRLIIGNTKCKIMSLKDMDVLKDIDDYLSYQIQGFQFMRIGNNWDGRYRLLTKNGYFPIGMLPAVEIILKRNGIRYETQDNRDKVIYGTELPILPESGLIPRWYQDEAVDAAYKAGGGILRAATGAGKSLMIAMIAAKYNTDTIVYVIGKELLYQMKSTIEKSLGVECGIIGDGKADIVKGINICTIWTAASAFNKKCKMMDNDTTRDTIKKSSKVNKEAIRNVVKNAKVIMIDECQYAASDTIQFLHRASELARHRFLLSGTPWRDTGDDILIESVGGPKFYDINATRLIEAGYLVRPKIHFVDVPIYRNVGRNYQEVYQNYIVENEERNNKIVNATKKLVASNRKALILVTKVEHGKSLLKKLEPNLRVSSLDGRNKTADRLAAIHAMKNGDLDVLIASKIFDQGIDIPELDALVLAGSGKSSARALQRIGRVIRTHGSSKKDAIIVDFYDNCKYLREHSQARFRIYSTEPGFVIKMPKRK